MPFKKRGNSGLPIENCQSPQFHTCVMRNVGISVNQRLDTRCVATDNRDL